MRTKMLLTLLLCCTLISVARDPIKNYDGAPLEWDKSFVRTRVGRISADNTLAEISGIACSRVTPGHIWLQGDDNYKVVAVQPDGTLVSTIKVANSYRDWEDLCGGVYNDTNYLFVGIFGDNGLNYANKYYIYYFKEPEIVEGKIEVDVDTIHFAYPDGKAHNAETLMYDNVEQMLYIVDKWNTVNSMGVVYSLPFRTDYDTVQTLTEICPLGNDVIFKNPTGGDISPDGKYIIVKNEPFMLIWTREDHESVADAMKRRPKQVEAYIKEDQGEAIAWLDSTTFYTTNDTYNGMAPLYMYTKQDPNDVGDILLDSTTMTYKTMDLSKNTLLIHHGKKVYTLLGNEIE